MTDRGPLPPRHLISGLMPRSRFLPSRAKQEPTRCVCPVVKTVSVHPELVRPTRLLTGGPVRLLGAGLALKVTASTLKYRKTHSN